MKQWLFQDPTETNQGHTAKIYLRHESVWVRGSYWGNFHPFMTTKFEKHLAFFTLVETNFKITMVSHKEIPQNVTDLKSMSMGHFCTFIRSVLSSWCQLIIKFSAWYFPSFKHNVVWIDSKVTVAHQLWQKWQ